MENQFNLGIKQIPAKKLECHKDYVVNGRVFFAKGMKGEIGHNSTGVPVCVFAQRLDLTDCGSYLFRDGQLGTIVIDRENGKIYIDFKHEVELKYINSVEINPHFRVCE